MARFFARWKTPAGRALREGYLILLVLALLPLARLAAADSRHKIRFGITAVGNEKDIPLNKKLAQYIGSRIKSPVEIVYRKSYQEMSFLLENKGVDAAFVCGLPYVLDHDKFGLELLASGVINGKPKYQSYLIVHRDSQIRSLLDLKGKVFAFSDPLSNSGYLVPLYHLSLVKETPDTFFKKYFFTYSHANSIEAVAMRLADGANVDSYVWDLTVKRDPKLAAETRIIHKSGYMPFTPMVARPDLGEAEKTKLRLALLSMHESPEGKEILSLLSMDRFEMVSDSDYNSIRTMYKAVIEWKYASRKRG